MLPNHALGSPQLLVDRRADSIAPKLELQQLSKSYIRAGKHHCIFESVNLSLAANEMVALVGASGCGKSTLLQIVAGLVPGSTGQVLVDGQAIAGPGGDRGMVFQNYTLFPWLTVAGNVAFGLDLQGYSKAEKQRRVAHFLDVVGLADYARAFPKQLSGGMKQRVAIARALANEPEVLLMDEPFGALDVQTKEQMQLFLRGIWQRTHTTILMVTHDIEEAIFLSQRVYVMGTNPGGIKAEVTIPFGEERSLDLKLEPEFIQIKRRIIDLLGH
jgi:NitT/TauT family transport system ATP-binding protein